LKAKKKFGQNFLVDRYFISKIIKEINPKEGNNILEIGPGKGAITEPVLKKINHISVVEIDPDMVKILKHRISTNNISILAENVLSINDEFFKKFNKIIGNLPLLHSN
jgi:16S rRNA (adenine1518-N6/adenine1519-N6)-dimethyltransferase